MKNTVISVPDIEDWQKVVKKLIDEMGCMWINGERDIGDDEFCLGRSICVEKNFLIHVDTDDTKRGFPNFEFLTTKKFLKKYKTKN